MTIAPWLCRLGHVATTAQLRASRITHSALSVALRDGAIERIVRGTFACAHLDGRMRDAAHSRTLIDCVSALDAHADVWSGILRTGLHVRAEPGRHIGALPEGTVVHWSARHEEQTFDLEVAPVDALLSVMRCLDPYDVIACIESALHLGYLNEQEFKRLRDLAPKWMLAYLTRIDRGAQSGLETHPRLWLQDLGHRVETQVPIPGAGVLDLLVDGIVGIETDGAKWHAHRFLADRSKDVGIERWGIRVLRIGRPHIFDTWPDTLATIERMLGE